MDFLIRNNKKTKGKSSNVQAQVYIKLGSQAVYLETMEPERSAFPVLSWYDATVFIFVVEFKV